MLGGARDTALASQHTMSSQAIQTLRRYEGRENVVLADIGAALTLTLVRNPVSITVTVPKTVREWFVDAVDEFGASASDWRDYDGYDGSLPEQLGRDMAADIATFLDALLVSELRLRPGSGPERCVLEWLVEGVWRQAL